MMATLSLEELYSRYIKPRPRADRIKLVEMTERDLADTRSGTDIPKTRSLLELEGLGAEIWEGVDAQEYVNQLRSEWDHRP